MWMGQGSGLRRRGGQPDKPAEADDGINFHGNNPGCTVEPNINISSTAYDSLELHGRAKTIGTVKSVYP